MVQRAKEIPVLVLVAAALVLAVTLYWRPAALLLPNQYFSPPPKIEHLTFGEAMSLADTMWIRAIQDFDYCDSPVGEKVCRGNSWLFKMIDAITELDPKFLTAHSAGALALSVLVSDIPGAAKIFEKSVQRFPSSWKILMQAAYHAIYEEKNTAKAAELMERAAKAGAPPWTYSLAAKLYTENGKKEFGVRIYEDLKSQNMSPEILERIKKRLEL
jgi:hypothetical protein